MGISFIRRLKPTAIHEEKFSISQLKPTAIHEGSIAYLLIKTDGNL